MEKFISLASQAPGNSIRLSCGWNAIDGFFPCECKWIE